MFGLRTGLRVGLFTGLAGGIGADQLGGMAVNPQTTLTIALADSADPVASGDTYTYTAQVENTGAVTATGLIVTITLDANVTWVSTTGTGWSLQHVGQIVTATLSSLVVGLANPIVVTVAATHHVGLTATSSASCACINAPTANDSEQTTLTFSELAGRLLIVDELGVPRWQAPFPAPWSGHYFEFENGGAGPTAQGLNAWITTPLVASGATRVALTSGEASWFNNACSINTGTVSNGYLALQRDAAVFASATSGTWVYEASLSLPVLSDGTETFSILLGFANSVDGTVASEGAYLRYKHSTNGGRFEFVTAHAARTAVDSGITATAGYYYRLRIELINNTTARFWLKTIYAGAGYADDGVWSAMPDATITTNIPTGAGSPFGALCAVLKSVGTTVRSMKLGYQLVHRTPPYTGEGGNDPGTQLRVDVNGDAKWDAALLPSFPILWQAWAHGGWVPSIASTAAPPFGQSFGGSGSNGSITGTTVDNGYLGSSNLNTGAAADGYVATHTSKTIVIDADMGVMVYEMSFSIPTISTGVQEHVAVLGFMDEVVAASANGVWLEINSNVAAAAQCKCVTGGIATTTTSGLTIVAATRYILRIVVTPTSVDFYLKAEGAAGFGAPVATITTNIPSGVAMHAAAMIRKLVGTTSRNVQYQSILAFQRIAA